MLSCTVWMIVSAFLYSLQNVGARFSGNVFGFWTMCVCRGLVGSWVCAVVLFFSHPNKQEGTQWCWLLIRSLLGGATILTSFFAILNCGLSTTSTLTSTAPLWTSLMDYMVSPKKYRRSDLGIALWCMGGLGVLLSGSHQDGHYVVGVVSAIVSAILQSAVNLTIRKLDKEDPAWVALWGMAGSMVLGMPGLIYETAHRQQKPHFGELEWMSLLTTGVLSAAAQYCKTYSLQISNSMSVLFLRYTEVVFSVIWDALLFHQKLPWQTTTGIILLGTGCIAKLTTDQKPTTPVLPT